jgi:hypothetical protein
MKFSVIVLVLVVIVTLLWCGTHLITRSHPANDLPEEALQVLRAPSNAVLYSLEPTLGQTQMGDVAFHDFKVLGQTNLDLKQAQLAANVFQQVVKNWDGRMARCFNPRHALRILSGDHTYDFLLCYSCHQLYVYKDDKLLIALGATGSPQFLNELLSAAQVPLSHSDTEEQQLTEQKK